MNNEYIRREDAKDALQEKVFHNLTDEFYGAMQVLDELPSADVAPVRHSRWSDEMERVDTYHPFAGFETDYYHRCLNCGHRGKGFSWNFCPYCGAKMDEEE